MTQISLRDYLSQNTLVVSHRCNIACWFCPLWRENTLQTEDLVALIKSGKFFAKYRRARLFNVIGGDPSCNDDLIFILVFLQSEGIKVRMWTNGFFAEEEWEKMLPWVDAVGLYIPGPTQGLYRAVAGDDGFPLLDPVIELIRGAGKLLILHYPVRQDTVQYLPEMYDLAYAQRLPVYFHYRKSENLSKESKNYLRRFDWVINSFVFSFPGTPAKNICVVYPFPVRPWCGFVEAYAWLRNKYLPDFILKRWLG